jgi:hypothetical protein
MKKNNNLFLFFSFLVVLQLNIAMDQELNRSEMISGQKNKFFYFDQQNCEVTIVFKLNKNFDGAIRPNIVFSTFKHIVEGLSSDSQAENFDGYLEKYLHSLNQGLSKDEAKDGLLLNKSLKKDPYGIGKYTVGALLLAALTAGGYYFRQGIGKHVGKVRNYLRKASNMAKQKGSFAWQYLKAKAVNFK